jgi:hypothetical protein
LANKDQQKKTLTEKMVSLLTKREVEDGFFDEPTVRLSSHEIFVTSDESIGEGSDDNISISDSAMETANCCTTDDGTDNLHQTTQAKDMYSTIFTSDSEDETPISTQPYEDISDVIG